MNRINFGEIDKLPASMATWKFVQEMASLAACSAGLAGGNHILQGCEDNGGQISDGFVLREGEIIPFKGGYRSDQVVIMEYTTGENDKGESINNIYTHRYATFGTGVISYPWKDFSRVTLKELCEHLKKHERSLNPHGIGKNTIGLGNVDNAQQATKEEFNSHKNSRLNPHGVSAAQVGLGNVDNTADVNKPISNATRKELEKKVDESTIYYNKNQLREGFYFEAQGVYVVIEAIEFGKCLIIKGGFRDSQGAAISSGDQEIFKFKSEIAARFALTTTCAMVARGANAYGYAALDGDKLIVKFPVGMNKNLDYNFTIIAILK